MESLPEGLKQDGHSVSTPQGEELQWSRLPWTGSTRGVTPRAIGLSPPQRRRSLTARSTVTTHRWFE